MHVPAATCAALLVALLDIYVGTRYCAKLIRRQAHPRIATWLIFEIGVIMSLAAYFTSPTHTVVNSALNVTDAVMVTLIIAALLFEQRTRKIRFTRNEQSSLVIAFITLAAWAITRTPWIGFAGFQIVMIIAYIPTIESVWQWKPGPPPEPAETWSLNALAALIGVFIDITGPRHDYMAMLYPLRAFTLCAIVVLLVLRWKLKNKPQAPHLN